MRPIEHGSARILNQGERIGVEIGKKYSDVRPEAPNVRRVGTGIGRFAREKPAYIPDWIPSLDHASRSGVSRGPQLGKGVLQWCSVPVFPGQVFNLYGLFVTGGS